MSSVREEAGARGAWEVELEGEGGVRGWLRVRESREVVGGCGWRGWI